MVTGARVLLRVLRALCVCCFVSPLLDSNPAWLLGPTANRFAHVIVGEVRFLCCPLRLMLLPVGASPPLLWRAGRVLLSFPCLGHVRAALRVVWVGAPRVGAFGWFPFTCGWAVISALRAAREHAPCGGVVAGRGGVDCVCGVGMPRDCAWLVQLRGFLVFGAWCCLPGLRVCACLCAPCLCACCRAPCFGWGVLLRSSQCVRAAVCLSVAACGGARCWFVAVYVVCRLLCGVRFVSAPAPTVMWFILVGAGVHLTATLVVAYCLLCKGCFWQFAARFCVPGCSR